MTQQEPVSLKWNAADVDVILALNPEFKNQLTIATVSRMRAENVERMEKEALEAAEAEKAEGKKKPAS